VRSIVEWVRVRELAAEGLSQREIARRLSMNRRTVARLAAASQPPRYRRAPTGSALDPLEPLMRQVLAEWPRIHAPRMTELLCGYGYTGSERVVRRRLSCARPPPARPSAPAMPPARSPRSTGPRCRAARCSLAASGASTP
jgi:transposase